MIALSVRTRRLARTVVAVGVLGLAAATPAQAIPFSESFGPVSSDAAGADFSFDLVVPTTIVGDATLTLTLDGDFGTSRSEYATIVIDGFSLGRVADEDPGNDLFDFAREDDPDVNPPGPDSASDAGYPFSGTAIIANLDIAPLLADGLLSILVDTSRSVSGSTTTVGGRLSFETAATPVSEPATLMLLGLPLILGGLGFIRRRRSGLAAERVVRMAVLVAPG